MKLQNLKGQTAKVNHSAYNTWLEPYIGHNVEISKIGKTYVKVVTDYGNGEFGEAKCDINYFDFNEYIPQIEDENNI